MHNQSSFWKRSRVILVSMTLALGGFGIAKAMQFPFSHAPLALKLANPDEGTSQTGFASVVKKDLPTVVKISSTKISKVPTDFSGQMPDDPLFRQFFGNNSNGEFNAPRQAPEQREEGLGSGVIMTPDGYILTNNHVVDGATDVEVSLSDNRQFKAKVIGTDPKSDIAVLKIDATNLPCITVGDSSKVQVGDYALAIGDPFGVGQTVTMGIVSATGRSNLGIEDYEDFIQTDASINPGNSGGALVNDRGELIGINTAIIAHGSEGNQGIGFAIPIDMARSVMQQIVETGKVTRGYLGIVPQDVNSNIANAFGEKDPRGALVADVSPDSPAQRSGLKRGDIIVDVNGKPVADGNGLRMTISMMTPDSNVDLTVLRNGAERQIPVKLGAMPTSEAAVTNGSSDSSSSALSGVSVQNLDADSAHDLKLPSNTQGVVVTNVDPSSDAAAAGLQQGDVIQEVNRQPVRNTSDFEHAVQSSKDKPLLLVDRNGTTMFLVA